MKTGEELIIATKYPGLIVIILSARDLISLLLHTIKTRF